MQDIVISVIANLISAINEIVHPISASCSAALPLFHVFPFATAAAMPLGLFVSAFLSTSGRAAISAPVPLFCISVAFWPKGKLMTQSPSLSPFGHVSDERAVAPQTLRDLRRAHRRAAAPVNLMLLLLRSARLWVGVLGGARSRLSTPGRSIPT